MKQTKLIIICVLFFLISTLSIATSSNSDDDNNVEMPKHNYIIKFKDNSNKALTIQQEGEQYKLKHEFKKVPFSLIEATDTEISVIQTDPNVESIEPDQEIQLFGSEQTIPWGINKVNAPNVWNEGSGKNVKIGVIDSGIINHDDLSVVGGVSFIDNKSYDNDELGHGTSVAGVIAAQNNDLGIVGVAPDSELYSVKVIDSNGSLSDLLKGIEWSIDNNMNIIVISLGVAEDSPALRALVDEAYLNGILVIAASGRDGQFYYPAKYSSVIAVGSVDENNQLGSENGIGEEMELVAPGENILSTNNQNGYETFSGTSMAAPHVAGVAALLKEKYPSYTPNEIRAKLQRDALDLGEQGKDNYFGYGLVYADLNEEILGATIQIVFPEETNETKKEELEINPIKVEIVKVNGEIETVVQTLFYDGNQGTQNISVEAGQYKVKQYFDDEVYSENYNVTPGESIVVPLYKTEVGREYKFDAPWRVKPSTNIPVLFEIRDADYNAYSFYYINIYDDLNDNLIYTLSLSNLGLPVDGTCLGDDYTTINEHIWSKVIYLNPIYFSKDAQNNVKIRAQWDGSTCGSDGDVTRYITINIDTKNLPKFSNWYCGDTHYHSKYTETEFVSGQFGEFGAPLDATFASLNAMGLDWITITDHSNAFNGAEYCNSNWNTFVSDCNSYNGCLIGEEINCGYTSTYSGGNHYLGYRINSFVSDDFGGCTPTNSNPSCSAIISSVGTKNGFGYAAHPESTLDALGFINVINKWSNYSLNFNGLEIWNGDLNAPDGDDLGSEADGIKITSDLISGLNQWKTLLLNGRKVFISAGTDAHGDFQEAFGKEYTCCYSSTAPGSGSFKSNIFNSLENGKCFMGNNGALKFKITTNGNTIELGGTGTVCEGDSTTFTVDYNLINSCTLKLYEGIIGGSESEIYSWGPNSGSGPVTLPATWGPGNSYYRVECVNTATNYRLYTNPIWINIDTTDTDGDGVSNCKDQCSSTPAGQLVDVNGCRRVDVDSDSDGVCNPGRISSWCSGSDNCQNTYGPACNNGCPDTTGPASVITTPTTNQNLGQTFTLQSTETDSCTVSSAEYKIDSGSWTAMSLAGTTATSTVNSALYSDGTHTIYVRGKDSSSNTGAETFVTVVFDNTLPTTTDNYGTKNNIWQNSAQTITLTPNCTISGCQWTKYCTSSSSCDPASGTYYTVPVTISTEGTSYFRYASKDNAGNTQTTQTLVVKIDTTPPILTISTPKNNTWYNSNNVPININAGETVKWIKESKDGSGEVVLCSDCNIYEYNWTGLSEGTHTLTVSVSDYFDSITTKTVEFYVDTVYPHLLSYSPPNGAYIAGTNAQTFSVTYTEINTDNVKLYWTGTWPYACNNINLCPPVTLSGCPSGTNVQCSANVDLSSYSEGEIIAYYFGVFDKTGKSAYLLLPGSKPYNVIIDRTPPTSSINALATTQNSYNFIVSWSGTDFVSGIATYDVEVNDNGAGWTVWQDDTTSTSATFTGQAGHTYQFRSNAKDNVGNTETKVAADTSTTIDIIEVSINLDLSTGWNLISIPLQVADNSVSSLLSSINGKYDDVWSYDATDTGDHWKEYVPGAPGGNDLTEVNEKQGIWVRMTSPATLTVNGAEAASTQIDLADKWNLIGYPTLTEKALPDALTGVNYDDLWIYDASDSVDHWKEYVPLAPGGNDLTKMSYGRGYWVRSSGASSWMVNW